MVTPLYVAPATRDNLRALYLRLRNTIYEVRKAGGELSLVCALSSAAGDCVVPATVQSRSPAAKPHHAHDWIHRTTG